MRIIFLLMLCYAFSANAQPKKITAESKIENVTVFSSGARIERSSNMTISAGRSEIIFASLSNQLDQQTVRLTADQNITLISVQATRDFLKQRVIETLEKSFTDRISTLQEKLEQDQKLLEVYKNEESMLIKNQAIGGQSGVKTAELKEALDLHRQRLTEVFQKQIEISRRIAAMRSEITATTTQLAVESKKKDSITYVVTATILSKESRNVNFRLMYNVSDAGWYPTFDVRVTDMASPLSVLLNANVYQRSGESWKDVSLLLSTGNPSDNATPSEIQPWKLGFYDPSYSWSAARGNTPGLISGRITNENGEPIPYATVTVKGSYIATAADANGFFKIKITGNHATISISAVGYNSKEISSKPGYVTVILNSSSAALQEVVVTGYSKDRSTSSMGSSLSGKVAGIQVGNVATVYQPTTTVYKVEEKYSLETDGKTTTIGIRNIEIPAIYDYFTAPKIDPSAFLTARIINWQEYELLSGESSLYFEGSYLGKTYIDLSSTADTLSLSLGKDNGIKISRKLLKEYSSKKFIGSNKTDSRHYEISVKNTKRTAVTVTVADQFPVSVTKEIDVDDVKADGAEIDKETGIAKWTITLQPGEEKKLNISYRVKYPKDRKVVVE